MFCQFKQAVCFFDKVYKVGVNEVPPEVQRHPFFAAMVKAALIYEVDAPVEKGKAAPEPSAQELSKKLAEKLTPEEPPKKKKG